MLLTDLVAPNAIVPALKVNSKKQALHELAGRAAELSGQSGRAILEILQQREKLGSTGVGNGIAIPHGKLPKLGKLFGFFARLERPVDFEALDGQPVDLIFLLLAPETAGADHLKALARVARLLRVLTWRASCASRATPKRSTPCWRCRRPAQRSFFQRALSCAGSPGIHRLRRNFPGRWTRTRASPSSGAIHHFSKRM